MSSELDRAVMEKYTWYRYHRSTMPQENLQKRIDFLERVIKEQWDLLSIMATDLKLLEGPRRKLFLPRSIKMSGDPTRLNEREFV